MLIQLIFFTESHFKLPQDSQTTDLYKSNVQFILYFVYIITKHTVD